MKYIYKITNKIDGSIYVGQTNNPKQRWSIHKYYSKHPEAQNGRYGRYPIYDAMRTYGIDNFSFEVIVECDDVEANTIEKTITEELKTQHKLYNIDSGTNHSAETNKKRSEALRGRVSPMKGRHQSDASKMKTSESMYRYWNNKKKNKDER